jgi:hypothetical protein
MNDDEKAKLKERILGAARDAARDFAYYGRKEDEDLPREQVEDAFHAGLVTVDEVAAAFRGDLIEWSGFPEPTPTPKRPRRRR